MKKSQIKHYTQLNEKYYNEIKSNLFRTFMFGYPNCVYFSQYTLKNGIMEAEKLEYNKMTKSEYNYITATFFIKDKISSLLGITK